MTFWEYPNKFEAESIQNYKSYECCCKKTDFFLNFSLSKFFPHPQITSEKKLGSIFEMLHFVSELFFSRNFAYNQWKNFVKLVGVF